MVCFRLGKRMELSLQLNIDSISSCDWTPVTGTLHHWCWTRCPDAEHIFPIHWLILDFRVDTLQLPLQQNKQKRNILCVCLHNTIPSETCHFFLGLCPHYVATLQLLGIIKSNFSKNPVFTSPDTMTSRPVPQLNTIHTQTHTRVHLCHSWCKPKLR